MQGYLFNLFQSVVRPFIGTGIGRFHAISAVYNFMLGRFTIPEGDKTVEVEGYRITVPLRQGKHMDGISQSLILKGNYEPTTTAMFKTFLYPGMVAIDLGANIGYFTLLAAKCVGEKGRVYAFEPAENNYDLLMQNIRENNFRNIVTEEQAVSNKVGSIEFYIDRNESGGHSMFRNAVQWGNHKLSEPVRVRTISLDRYFKDSRISIDFIKMDIQGAETAALQGMRQTVKRSPKMKMIMEFWPYGLEKAGSSAQKCWDLMEELGFKYRYLINDNDSYLKLADLNKLVKHCKGNWLRPITAVNLLCCQEPVFGTNKRREEIYDKVS